MNSTTITTRELDQLKAEADQWLPCSHCAMERSECVSEASRGWCCNSCTHHQVARPEASSQLGAGYTSLAQHAAAKAKRQGSPWQD